ncbi:MAG: glycosyltransferase [Fluviibacter sp.]
MVRVLYIAYDGMLEPLGQSQVLAYQERLADQFTCHLLSFEKSEDWAEVDKLHALQARITGAGIHWHPRRYHKCPSALATAYDIMMGSCIGLWLILRYRIRIVHARSYVPAVMALVLKKLTGVRFVFDMRGFWADERVDGGLWPRSGRMYRVAKWFERQFLLNADHVISLTHAAVREMARFPYLVARMPPVTVIPTCADLARFCPQSGVRVGFVLGYVGSAGTWYEFDAAVACFAELLRMKPEARFLIINRNEHDYILERLKAGGVPLASVELREASHAEVPIQMARMHAGIFFYKPSFSRAACAPTKLAEFLGCGIPCLSNSGVGDMAEILEGEQVGVAVKGFSEESLRAGLERLLELVETAGIEARCVAAGYRHFSLEEGVEKYAAIYRSLFPNSKERA